MPLLKQYNKVFRSWLPKPTPILDEDSVNWIFDVFNWSAAELADVVSFNQSQLILPNNSFFPGREASLEGMAKLIFDQVYGYANIQGWKFQIVPQNDFEPLTSEKTTELILSFVNGNAVGDEALPVPYDPQMVANPEALIGSYAHAIAQYVALSSQKIPPGGSENFSLATEVLSIAMGFGVILANTGFTHRGGCGSCSASLSTRQSALSQLDITFALAIYCAIKQIPVSKVTSNLKSSLRGYYKKSFKDVQNRLAKIEELQILNAN